MKRKMKILSILAIFLSLTVSPPSFATQVTIRNTYDDLNRVISAGQDGARIDYNYDEIGNFTNKTICNDSVATDADNDGYYIDCGTSIDCDDTDAARFPGNPEICDGINNDCDVIVDENCTECILDIGDAELDGDSDIDDVYCIFRHIMGYSDTCLYNVNNPCADVDRDSDINIDDVFCLFRHVMGRSSCMD
jgi:hypothetical protein